MTEPGFYWVRVQVPRVDSGGVVDEAWGEPEVGRYDGLDWYLTGMAGKVADQLGVDLLLPADRIQQPPTVTATLDLLRFAVSACQSLSHEPFADAHYEAWAPGDLVSALRSIHEALEKHVLSTAAIRGVCGKDEARQ